MVDSGQPASTEWQDDRSFFGHPKGLAYLAFTEAWERFSFSGMQTLLVLYMVGHLLQPGNVEQIWGFASLRAVIESLYGPMSVQPLSSIIFGLYTSLVFFMPVFGGYLGDRFFGQHAMVLTGAVLMALGHFCMAFEPLFLAALLLLIIGAGCLKGNISTQVGGLYALTDRRRGDAFQIFSAGINAGVIAAPLICGTLGEVYGWHYGFGAAGIGMLIGLVIYVAGRKTLPPDTLRERGAARGPVLPADRRLVMVLALVFVLTTAFLVMAGQLGNTYNLWLKSEIDRSFFGLTVPVTWFHILTPLFSVLLAPIVVQLSRWQARHDREPALLVKMGLGLVSGAVGISSLALLAWLEGRGVTIYWAWVLPLHMLVTLAYLYVYPIGLALFSQAAPEGSRAMFIGVFFLTSFVASNIVGWVGSFYETMPPVVFWLAHACIGLAGALLVLVLARPLGTAVPRNVPLPSH